jgi:preprotein translocase subunit SecG
MKTLFITIIVILCVALIIFTIIHNNKEKNKFERQAGDDFKKPPVDD